MKQEKIAIHCPTEELWKRVQEKAFSEGWKWEEGGKSLRDYWHIHKEDTILSLWSDNYMANGDLNNPKHTRTVVEIGCVVQTQLDMAIGKCEMSWNKSKFLKENKLIHRGDEVGEKKSEVLNGVIEEALICGQVFTHIDMAKIYNEPKQTNKKEKKMKRAEKVIKEGMIVMDRDCRNVGKVEAIYVNQGMVTYTDQSDYTIHTVDIGRLYIPLEMPKPKPEPKKKAKKGKK